jgi:hypothetical protein
LRPNNSLHELYLFIDDADASRPPGEHHGRWRRGRSHLITTLTRWQVHFHLQYYDIVCHLQTEACIWLFYAIFKSMTSFANYN